MDENQKTFKRVMVERVERHVLMLTVEGETRAECLEHARKKLTKSVGPRQPNGTFLKQYHNDLGQDEFAQYQIIGEPEVVETNLSTCEVLSVKPVEPLVWEAIPHYGDLFLMEDFVACVEMGGFLDSDGFGNYAMIDKMCQLEVYPSDIKAGKRDHYFTHVVWFNK